VVWWLVLACRKKEPEALELPPPLPAPNPPAEAGDDALLRALSTRDGEPSCEALAALVPADPVGELLRVVRTVELPPVAPMRAARCLVVAHAEAAEAELAGWMSDPASEGYVRLVLNDLASVPTPVAVRLATAGLAGPHAALVRESVHAAAAPELRALAP
jgi:hypothetical protein